MRRRGFFLAAYYCSGLAALIYQVTWTRLVTLQMGHTMAAASTVIAAFMGGLAIGSVVGGRMVTGFDLKRALYGYAALECFVAVAALVLPLELRVLRPLLMWAYQDGTSAVIFPMVRLASCLFIILIPATALGATFPLAVRCFVRESDRIGRAAGALYIVNTAGAASGALLAGFILIPQIGIFGTSLTALAANMFAAVIALVLAKGVRADHVRVPLNVGASGRERSTRHRSKRSVAGTHDRSGLPEQSWVVAVVALGLSGFAALIHEITWIRVLSLIIGPTTYAFAAALVATISGMAVGSMFGSWLAGRTSRAAFWLCLVLGGVAIAVSVTSWIGGGVLPRVVVRDLAQRVAGSGDVLFDQAIVATGLIIPAAFGMGVAFPIGMELASQGAGTAAWRLGVIYAVNTLGAVAGSLAASFLLIPSLGLQRTLTSVSALVILDAVIVAGLSPLSRKHRIACAAVAIAAFTIMVLIPPWNRDLLASGVYKYAKDVENDFIVATNAARGSPQDVDELALESVLSAGRLMYYRDGAASTVSVKRRAGVLSLAIDGKIDASNAGDMLTQKALAHVPLLLHPRPRQIAIIGLGSGVTLHSALLHPIDRADVVEISPEVVEASRYFVRENANPFDDPRTHLIIGDGRTHLLLSSHKYDVVISEPSNPWMAGVAALFTQEFFLAVRDHLAAGGIVCQWAHTYDISESDLRSIVATFTSVFPNTTLWLIGRGDVLLVASADQQDLNPDSLARGWDMPSVRADLLAVSADEPFAFWSMFGAGPQELAGYAAGAVIQKDDRMALEFSGPQAINDPIAGSENARRLRELSAQLPPVIRQALDSASAVQWRNRANMMRKMGEYAAAYDNYSTSVRKDPTDSAALGGFVEMAVATRRESGTLEVLRSAIRSHPRVAAIPIALSRLLAASGSTEEAVSVARGALAAEPDSPEPLDQLASIFADTADASRLGPLVERMLRLYPQRASTYYYDAAHRFLKSQLAEALRSTERAISLDATYVAAYNLQGAVYGNLGQSDNARLAFQRALELNANDSSVYSNLGLLELTSGNMTAAHAYFAEALSLDPTSITARSGLARVRTATSE